MVILDLVSFSRADVNGGGNAFYMHEDFGSLRSKRVILRWSREFYCSLASKTELCT